VTAASDHDYASQLLRRALQVPLDVVPVVAVLRECLRRTASGVVQSYPIPARFGRRATRVQRLARFLDGHDESLDVIVIDVRDGWSYYQHLNALHLLAVQALRHWSDDAHATAVVIYHVPLAALWRIQFVQIGLETQRNHATRQFHTIATVTPAQAFCHDVSQPAQRAALFNQLLPLMQSPQAITLAQLQEGLTKMPTTPHEKLQQAIANATEALNEHSEWVFQMMQQQGLGNRPKYAQMMIELDPLATQWLELSQRLSVLVDRQVNPSVAPAPVLKNTPVTIAPEGTLYTLNDSWEHTQPIRFVHAQVPYKVSSWQQVYREILHQMYMSYGIEFINHMNHLHSREAKRDFFTNTTAECRNPKSIGPNDEWWYESNMSAQSMNAVIKRVYSLYNIAYDSFAVWVRR
jgi:hypothetical protein